MALLIFAFLFYLCGLATIDIYTFPYTTLFRSKHVMSGINPQGCQVFSFKHPSAEELDHDFLWRCARCLPERGRIGIFNRSYYEEVLIARIHRGIIASQHIPDADADDKKF